ncbi:MAG: branched-chain amino acid ABC transporter permease [Dichotomicrobium sp.]
MTATTSSPEKRNDTGDGSRAAGGLHDWLRKTSARRVRRDLALGLVLLVPAALYPLVGTTFYLQLLTSGLITGLVAMSFSLLAGFSGMVSLAQKAFYGMAAYVVAIGGQTYGLPPLATVPMALIGACLLAALFGLIAVRSSGIYFLIMTLALLQMFFGVAMQWQSFTGGYNGISGITRPELFGLSLRDAVPLYLLTLTVAVMVYVGLRWLLQTPFGLSLQGIRDRPERMRALGFRVQLHRWLLMILSGLVAGSAGILGTYYHGVVSPDVAGLTSSLLPILAALVGGVSSLIGGLLGGIFVTVLISVVSYLMQQWFDSSHYWTVMGLFFMAVVIYCPNGVLASDSRVRALLGRALERRRGHDRGPNAEAGQ